jgi:hypothetical protein
MLKFYSGSPWKVLKIWGFYRSADSQVGTKHNRELDVIALHSPLWFLLPPNPKSISTTLPSDRHPSLAPGFLSLNAYLPHTTASLYHKIHVLKKITISARGWWLTPVILATQEIEIRSIGTQGQPRQKVRLYLKNIQHTHTHTHTR